MEQPRAPFGSAFQPPRRRYVDVPALLDGKGNLALHVVQEQGALQGARGFRILSQPDAAWALYHDRLLPLRQDAQGLPRLPISGAPSDIALSAAGDDLAFAHGYDLFLLRAGDSTVRRRRLERSIEGVVLHARGVLVAHDQCQLALLGQDDLETRWSVDLGKCPHSVGPIPITDDSFYVVRPADAGAYELARVSLADGTVQGALPLPGTAVTRLVQSGSTLSFAASERESVPVPTEGYPQLHAFEVDLTSLTATSTPLNARKDGLGDIISSFEVLVDAQGKRRGAVVAVRGQPELLHWIADGKLTTSAFPKRGNDQLPYGLVQFGAQLVLAEKDMLNIVDIESREVRASIRVPGQIADLHVADGTLVINRLRGSPLRLAPGAEPASPPAIDVEPWRFGSPEFATDGDPNTTWRFFGNEAQVRFDFGRDVLIPPLTFARGPQLADPDGNVTQAQLTLFSDLGAQLERTLTPTRSVTLQTLTRAWSLAQRLEFNLKCKTAGGSPLVRACSVPELGPRAAKP